MYLADFQKIFFNTLDMNFFWKKKYFGFKTYVIKWFEADLSHSHLSIAFWKFFMILYE